MTQRDWLRNSGWDRDKDNMILIHGYGGSEDALPMSVLRDGIYLLKKNNSQTMQKLSKQLNKENKTRKKE